MAGGGMPGMPPASHSTSGGLPPTPAAQPDMSIGSKFPSQSGPDLPNTPTAGIGTVCLLTQQNMH